jgi:2-haloacid dehalogenase
MADMVKLSKLWGLPWDAVLTSELAQAVKPDPKLANLLRA